MESKMRRITLSLIILFRLSAQITATTTTINKQLADWIGRNTEHVEVIYTYGLSHDVLQDLHESQTKRAIKTNIAIHDIEIANLEKEMMALIIVESDDLRSIAFWRDQVKDTNIGKILFLITGLPTEEEDSQWTYIWWERNYEVIFVTQLSSTREPAKVSVLCPMSRGSRLNGLVTSSGVIFESASICQRSAQGRDFKVSVVGLQPYIIYKPTGLEGVDIDIMNLLSSALGFTYHFKYESAWSIFANGTLAGGTYHSVMVNLSHVGIGHPIPDANLGIVDIAYETSYITYPEDICYVGVKPKPLAPLWNLVRPYSITVWMSIIVVAIIFATLCAVLHYSDSTGGYLTGQNSLGLLLQQSIDRSQHKQSKLSAKVLMGSWLVFVFFITASFDCNLRAYLMVVDFEKPIESGHDILAAGKELWLLQGAALLEVLQNSPFEHHLKLAKQIEKGNQFFVLENGLPALESQKYFVKGGHAFSWARDMARILFMHLTPNFGYQPFRISKHNLMFYYSRFILQPRRPWNRDINTILERTFESGLVQYHMRKYVTLRYLLPDVKESVPPTAFALEHVFLVNICLAIGLGAAALVFSYEVIIAHRLTMTKQ